MQSVAARRDRAAARRDRAAARRSGAAADSTACNRLRHDEIELPHDEAAIAENVPHDILKSKDLQ